MTTAQPILSTHGLRASYGDFQALFGVDFHISAGEVVSLIGANGAGKSTLLKSILGLIRVDPQMVVYDGQPMGGTPAYDMVRNGIAIVPEGRRLFAGMSVEDNMRVAMDRARTPDTATPWTQERLFDLFPILRERRRQKVETLSGGQQQMVSISRALLCQPKVLLCDEISLGLAPKVVREIYAVIPEIRASGTAIVLVEQDVALAQEASDRLYCILEGRVMLEGKSGDIAKEDIAAAYFGDTHAVA